MQTDSRRSGMGGKYTEILGITRKQITLNERGGWNLE